MRAHLKSCFDDRPSWVIREATGVLAAQDYMRFCAPELIILADSGAPDVMAFTRYLRRRRGRAAEIGIVLCANHTDQKRLSEARDSGISDVLSMPISRTLVVSRIQNVLINPRLFIRSLNYVGPDRRRRASTSYEGPLRREDDCALAIE